MKNLNLKYCIKFIFVGVLTLMSLENKVLLAQNTTDSNLERIVNVRFGFAFFHPKDWIKREPDNGDGFRFINPNDQKVIISGYGSYYFPELGPTILKNGSFTLNKYLEEYYKAQAKDIIYDLESSCIATNWDEETEISNKTITFARRVNFKKDGLVYMMFKSIYDQRVITVLCQAPEEVFQKYEAMFTRVTENVEILPRPIASSKE